MDQSDILKQFIALLVITNPIANLPLFISLAGDQSDQEKKKTAGTMAIAVLVIIAASIWGGLPILHFFGISVPAFSVGGGLIVLMIGLSMLHSKESGIHHSDEEHEAALERESIAVVPLAIPIFAGPGVISTGIHLAQEFNSVTDHLILTGIALLVSLCLWIITLNAGRVQKLLGANGLKITGRVMGMILVAIAVEMMAGGLGKIFPGLLQKL